VERKGTAAGTIHFLSLLLLFAHIPPSPGHIHIQIHFGNNIPISWLVRISSILQTHSISTRSACQ